MRYFVLVLLGMFSVVFSGSFAAGITIFGIQVDLLLLIVVALSLVDKTTMPIYFAALSGLFMDILYSTVLGMYALSYTLVAATVLIVFRKMIRFNVLSLFATGAGSYLLKEIVNAIVVRALGGQYSIGFMLVRYILPAALLSGALLLLVYYLTTRLYQNTWMRAPKRRSLDEL